MPSAVNTFPHEIWLNIAKFIPNHVLEDLISLNSTFFHVGMDIRYRQMSFVYFDNRMVRNLARLKDPAVAKLVRILHVFPGYIKETMDNRMEQPSFRSMKSRLLTLGNILLEEYLFLKCFPRHRFMRMLRRSEDVVQLMLDVLSGLPNVTDYFVTWCGPPSTSTTVFSFLPTVVQSNLRKFSLEISLENVMNLITPSFHLPHLEELHLSIHSENIPSAEERRAIMTDRLAPAINCLKTLQTLTIHSWEPADLSPLFYAICRLPSLQSLTVAIPVEDVHLGNPEAFAYFLHSHASTLHTLRLRASQYGGAGLTPDEISFDTWVREAICTVELPNLGTLDISSHLFPSLTAEACVRRFGCSVRSLSLTGCYRSYERVEDLLNIVLAYQPQQPLPMELEVNEERQQQEETTDELPLERLRLGIVSLSPQLMRLIEIKLPRLQKLDLIVRYMLPHALDFPEMQKVSEGQSCEQVEDFLDAMDANTFDAWELKHMTMIAERLPNRAEYQPIIEQTFLQCIPSLKTFT